MKKRTHSMEKVTHVKERQVPSIRLYTPKDIENVKFLLESKNSELVSHFFQRDPSLLFLSFPDQNFPIHIVVLLNWLDGLIFLYEFSYNIENYIEIKGQNGYTALGLAASKDFYVIAKHLISVGACLEAKNNKGFTPLCHAVNSNSFRMIKLLVDSGATVDVKAFDVDKTTPLILSMNNNNVQIFEYLILNGADLNVIDGKNRNPFQFAVEFGSLKVVKLLVRQVINIDEARNYLWGSFVENKPEIVYYLLKKGLMMECPF